MDAAPQPASALCLQSRVTLAVQIRVRQSFDAIAAGVAFCMVAVTKYLNKKLDKEIVYFNLWFKREYNHGRGGMVAGT